MADNEFIENDNNVMDAIVQNNKGDDDGEKTPKPRPEADDDVGDEGVGADESDEEHDGEEPDEGAEQDEGDEGLVDVDDVEIEVPVDGKPTKVTIAELKKSYSGTKYIEQQVQKASEARNFAEQTANKVFEANKVALQRLQKIDQVLGAMANPQDIDWAELKSKDPQAYILKREEQRDYQEKQRVIRQEAQRIAEEQAAIQADARKRFLDGQGEALLAKLPDMGDPKKAPKLMGRLVTAAAHYGYSKEEVGTVMDHRAFLVLNDAAKWRELQSKKVDNSQKPSVKKLMLRPAANKGTVRPSMRQADKDNLNRARKTGSPDDVAATLLVRSK